MSTFYFIILFKSPPYFLTYTLASDDVVQYVSILEKIQKNDYYDGQLERVANDLVNDLDEWLTIIAE